MLGFPGNPTTLYQGFVGLFCSTKTLNTEEKPGCVCFYLELIREEEVHILTVLYMIELHCTLLYCTALYCTLLYSILLKCISLYCSVPDLLHLCAEIGKGRTVGAMVV